MRTVILRLGTRAPAEVSWLELEGGSGVCTGSLSEAGRSCRGAKLLVLLPASEVLLTRVVIPGRNRARAILAAPFALEESLADELDKLHFAYGPRNQDGSMEVAVVAKRAMAHGLAMLAEAGLEAESLLAETLAVPWQEGWSLLVEGDAALLRTGERSGLAVDLVNLPALLAAESDLGGESGRGVLTVYQARDDQRLLSFDSPHPPVVKRGEPLSFLAAGINREGSIELLQGDYRRHTNWEQLWSRWQRPLLCGAALLLLQSGLAGMEYYQRQAQSRALKARIEAVYRATFPEARQVVNPRAQMEQRLAALAASPAGEGGLLPVLSQIGPELMKGGGVTLQRLRYRAQVTELELLLPNLAAADELRGRLGKIETMKVEFQTGSAAKDELVAHLTIKEKRHE